MANVVLKERVHKRVLDRRVALLHDMHESEVKEITDAFLEEVIKHILDEKEVLLTKLGVLHLVIKKGKRRVILTKGVFKKGVKGEQRIIAVTRKYYVMFRRALALKKRIRERFGAVKTIGEK